MRNLTITAVYLISAMLSFAMAQIETAWTSQVLVPGEQTTFYIISHDGQDFNVEATEPIKGASIRPAGGGYARMDRNSVFSYKSYIVSVDQPGEFSLSGLVVKKSNQETAIPAQVLNVVPFSEVQWHPMPMTDGKLKYGTLWYISNKTPYVNQAVQSELKIYAPQQIDSYQIPSINKNGVAADRFMPLPLTSSSKPQGTALLQGYEWLVMTFKGEFYPLREGEVSLSGEVNANALDGRQDNRFYQLMANYVTVPFPLPEIKLTAKAFPANAPKDFKKSVGQFQIKASTKAPDLSANEPIIVEITVQGHGNFNSIECPELADPSKWKLYPATKIGDIATNSDGSQTVQFQQSMRPMEEVDGIPPFRMSYFDPETGKYQTATTPAIPLPWKHGGVTTNTGAFAPAEPPPAGSIPVEKMTDIYGLVPAPVISSLQTRYSLYWYLLAFIPFIFILFIYAVKLLKRRNQQHAQSRERWAAFKKITPETPTSQFLRSLGSFIETNIPADDINQELTQILEERDSRAFLPDTATNEIPVDQKTSMLKVVKKALQHLPVLLVMFIACGHFSQAQENKGAQLYQSGEYSAALENFHHKIDQEHEQAANYYGQGNSLYRLKKPGEAALAYYRALEICPNFTEAKLNLQFIQRKEGAILPKLDSSSQWLVMAPYYCLPPAIILSTALFLTCLSLLLIYRKHPILLSTVGVLALTVAGLAITNYYLYPETPESIAPEKLLVAINQTPARHSADKDSPVIVTIPPSTPLILEAKRGSWYYARTFTGTPVWVESSNIMPVLDNPQQSD